MSHIPWQCGQRFSLDSCQPPARLHGVFPRRPKLSSLSFCRQQISQLMTRCTEVLSSMYAPVPEDADDEDAWDSTTNFFNSTRNVERGNRHVREKNIYILLNIGFSWDVMFALWRLFIQIALETEGAVSSEAYVTSYQITRLHILDNCAHYHRFRAFYLTKDYLFLLSCSLTGGRKRTYSLNRSYNTYPANVKNMLNS